MSNRSFRARVRERQRQTGQPYQLAFQHVRMVQWFLGHYERPEVSTPYEGEFIFVNGGPYDARELLEDQFPDANADILDAVVAEVEQNGNYRWVPRFVIDPEA